MSSYSLDVLKLAFTRHVLAEIAHADNELAASEALLLEKLCPPAALEAAGLLDENGETTAMWQHARAQALEELPHKLDFDAKLAILTSLVEMAVVDGHFHRDEGSLLFRSAALLAITPQQFDRHLDTLTEHVGSVELD